MWITDRIKNLKTIISKLAPSYFLNIKINYIHESTASRNCVKRYNMYV
jgi:hypothetical protein